MKKQIFAPFVLALAVLAGCASMSAKAPTTVHDGMMATDKGLTLYTFDRDVANSGKSVCNGDCAVKWPPHMATASDKPSGDYTIVKRDDGSLQWAYKGKPLYTWPEDTEPGDKFGDDYNKVWHIISVK